LAHLLDALVRMQPCERASPTLPDSQVPSAQDRPAAASSQRHPPTARESPGLEPETTVRVWALSERTGAVPVHLEFKSDDSRASS